MRETKKRSIEFLVADDGLEIAVRHAIGPMRRFSVRNGRRRREKPREVSKRVVVTWARHLTSRQRFLGAGREDGTAILVLVEPETPVEVLSEASRFSASDRSELLFVRLERPLDVHPFLYAFVRRLSLADESERVLHAWWMDGVLRVLTTEFRRLDVPRRSIPALRGRHFRDCAALEVPSCGTGILWPPLELALGFDDIARGVVPGPKRP